MQVLACYNMYGWQDEIWSRMLSKLLPEFDKLSDAQTAIWITMRQDLTALWCYHSDRSFYPQRLWFATSTITLHTSNWNAHIWPAQNIARWRSNASLPMWTRGILAGRLCVFFRGRSQWHCRSVPSLSNSQCQRMVLNWLSSPSLSLFSTTPCSIMWALKYKPTFIYTVTCMAEHPEPQHHLYIQT